MSLSSVLALRSVTRLLDSDPQLQSLEARVFYKSLEVLNNHDRAMCGRVLACFLQQLKRRVLFPTFGSRHYRILTSEELAIYEKLKNFLDTLCLDLQFKVVNDLLSQNLSKISTQPSTMNERFSRPCSNRRPSPMAFRFKQPTAKNTMEGIIERGETILKLLPSEIRINIFKFAMPDEWVGMSPNLVKALRSEPNLYAEAVKTFFNKDRTFILHLERTWGFQDMPDAVLATIGKIKIVLGDRELGFESLIDSIVAHEVDAAPVLIAKFQKCNSVYEVGIETSWGSKGVWPLPEERLITSLLVGFQNICKVYFTFPNSLIAQEQLYNCTIEDEEGEDSVNRFYQGIHLHGHRNHELIFGCPIDHTNRILGVVGRTLEIMVWPILPECSVAIAEDDLDNTGIEVMIESEDLRNRWVERASEAKVETWVWVAEGGSTFKPVCSCEATSIVPLTHVHNPQVFLHRKEEELPLSLENLYLEERKLVVKGG